MRWTPGGVSGDIEDRRGMGGLRPMHIGLGGMLLLLLLSLMLRSFRPVRRRHPLPRLPRQPLPHRMLFSSCVKQLLASWCGASESP